MQTMNPIVLFVLAVAPAVRPAAPSCMETVLPEMRAAGSRADSIALAERYLREPPGGDQACGQLAAGYLLGMTTVAGEAGWQQRQQAGELINGALRNRPDESRLYLALGVTLYNRQSRTDAARALDRALERGDRGVPLTAREVAIVHYLRGLMYQDQWRDWRSFGDLKATGVGQWRCSQSEAAASDNFTSSAVDYTWLIPINQLCPDRFTENIALYYDPRSDMKRDALRDLEAAFARAMATDSTFLAPGEALLSEWVYLKDWERARPVAEQLVGRFPDDFRPRLYAGLVDHETGRDSAAVIEFGQAARRMPDSVAAVFNDVTALLRPDQLAALNALDSAGQALASAALWTSLDPVFLTTINERRTEHWARMAAAGLLFGEPSDPMTGWQSFAGKIWVRYGRPKHIWELAYPAGRVVFWDYGPGPDVTFTRGTAFRRYQPTDEGVQVSNRLARVSPQTYDPSALFDTTMALRSQVARMLGPGGKPQLLAYAEWPDSLSEEADAGLTLLDLMYQPVAQWRGRTAGRPGLSAELNGMAAGQYSLTVEVWDHARGRLYRLRDTISTLPIEDSTFVVSDLVLAGAVSAPRDDVVSRRDLTFTPLYGGLAKQGAPLGLIWEIYRLVPPTDGRVRYRVVLEVRDAGQQPMLARVLRGIGIRGEQRRANSISYETTRPMTGGRAVEWVELSSDLKPGDYRVVMHLYDEDGGGREVIRERRFQVR
jgi:GWxTD domain-containing protein